MVYDVHVVAMAVRNDQSQFTITVIFVLRLNVGEDQMRSTFEMICLLIFAVAPPTSGKGANTSTNSEPRLDTTARSNNSFDNMAGKLSSVFFFFFYHSSI